MTYTVSPMVALMRECIATPCRGSDLGGEDLINVVRQEAGDSPLRRTGLRSSKRTQRNVTFEIEAVSPTRISARKKRSTATPRKALSQKDENARPLVLDVVGKKDISDLSHIATISKREIELSEQVTQLQDEVEEKDAKIRNLTELVSFLSAEVKVYTKTLEEQLHSQQLLIESLSAHGGARSC